MGVSKRVIFRGTHSGQKSRQGLPSGSGLILGKSCARERREQPSSPNMTKAVNARVEGSGTSAIGPVTPPPGPAPTATQVTVLYPQFPKSVTIAATS